jgi:hypothetical protein
MRRIVATVVVLLLAWPALADDGKPKDKQKEKQAPATVPALPIIGAGQNSATKQDEPTTPNTVAGKYQALVEEYNQARQKFFQEYPTATTTEERQKLLKDYQTKMAEYPARFMELAQKYPKDRAVIDVLSWVVMNAPSSPNAKTSPKAQAISMLLKDHVKSDRIGSVCQMLARDFQDKDAATLLRAVMEKNPNPPVQGQACLALAQQLDQKASTAKELTDESNAEQYERFLGKDVVAELKKVDITKLEAQSEQLYRRFADKYLADEPANELDMLAQRLGFQPSKGGELILRRLVNDTKLNVKADTRGKATMALADSLKQRAEALPDAQLKEGEKLNQESEKLCETVIAKYGTITRGRATLGEQARKLLYELRFLSKGKTAPEVEGTDADGKTFKLSDYKGKVVLLDFWGEW